MKIHLTTDHGTWTDDIDVPSEGVNVYFSAAGPNGPAPSVWIVPQAETGEVSFIFGMHQDEAGGWMEGSSFMIKCPPPTDDPVALAEWLMQ